MVLVLVVNRRDWIANGANTNAGRMRIVQVSILDVQDESVYSK
jgi:hypothetical protein